MIKQRDNYTVIKFCFFHNFLYLTMAMPYWGDLSYITHLKPKLIRNIYHFLNEILLKGHDLCNKTRKQYFSIVILFLLFLTKDQYIESITFSWLTLGSCSTRKTGSNNFFWSKLLKNAFPCSPFSVNFFYRRVDLFLSNSFLSTLKVSQRISWLFRFQTIFLLVSL